MHQSATRMSHATRAFRIPAASLVLLAMTLAGVTACGSSGANKQDDSRTAAIRSACKSDLKSVEIAAEAYYARHGEFPSAITDLVDGNFLAEAPTSSDYTIHFSPAAGNAEPEITGTVNRSNRPC